MYFNQYIINIDGAVAQLARAPALQAGGQEFDSPQLHQADLFILLIINKTKQKLAIIIILTRIWNYKQAVQGKRLKNCEIVHMYIEQF